MRRLTAPGRRDGRQHSAIAADDNESLDRLLRSTGRAAYAIAECHLSRIQPHDTGELRRVSLDRKRAASFFAIQMLTS